MVSRLDEIEALRRAGDATEADLLERFRIIWPQFFASSPPELMILERVGVQSSTEKNASLVEHFRRGTLVEKLPDVRLPVLLLHGEVDPLPARSQSATAALIDARWSRS